METQSTQPLMNCDLHSKVVFVHGRNLNMVAGSSYLPKKNESKPLGEDAHFICQKEQTFGVADGVGGWVHKGIDAGKYARKLMDQTAHAVQSKYQEQPEWANIDPFLALNQGFHNTVGLMGSSTACVLTLRHDNILHCFNVGDSGFVVIREGQVVYKSPVQQSEFNCPYQLGNTEDCDCPSVGEELLVGIMGWDIIVVGTDGLFDNVFDNEIEELVYFGVSELEKPEELASRIAKFALKKAEDGVCKTPFATAAAEAGQKYSGGKYDDITVIVAYVFPT